MKYDLGDCRLAEVLREHRLTQQQLADSVPMSRQQVSDFANNRRKMTLKNAISIAETIGCSVRDLYELKPVEASKRGRQSEKKP